MMRTLYSKFSDAQLKKLASSLKGQSASVCNDAIRAAVQAEIAMRKRLNSYAKKRLIAA